MPSRTFDIKEVLKPTVKQLYIGLIYHAGINRISGLFCYPVSGQITFLFEPVLIYCIRSDTRPDIPYLAQQHGRISDQKPDIRPEARYPANLISCPSQVRTIHTMCTLYMLLFLFDWTAQVLYIHNQYATIKTFLY